MFDRSLLLPLPSTNERAPPMGALTSLRFFASFHVVLFHAFPWNRNIDPEVRVGPWDRFCEHGFAAVGFFFALSGFILAYNYPATRLVDRVGFYRARFARIYPVYLLGLCAGLPFLVVHARTRDDFFHAALELLLALTLTQAWVPPLWNAVNPPGWSLSVEAFFYTVFPRLSLLLAQVVRTRFRAYAALTMLFLSAVGPASLATFASPHGMLRTDESNLANAVRYCPALALPEFAFGMVLARIHLEDWYDARLTRMLVLPILACLGLILSTDLVPYMLLHNGVLLPGFAVIILACARPGLLQRWLAHPLLEALGEASYSLYVLHLLVWVYLKIVLERSGFDPGRAWVFPAYAFLMTALSLASHRLLEVPARRKLLSAPARPRERTPA